MFVSLGQLLIVNILQLNDLVLSQFKAANYMKENFDGSKTLTDSKTEFNKLLTSNLRKYKDPDQVLATIQKNRQKIDCISIATAFISVAYIIQQRNYRNDRYKLYIIRTIYLELFSLTEKHVEQMQHQAVANSLWSIGKLFDIFGYKLIEEDTIEEMLSVICERLLCVVDNMNAQEITNSLWAMGKQKYRHDRYIQALVEATYKQSEMNPQQTSNTLWALAVLQYGDMQIINRLIEWSEACITEMNGQDISNSLWALMQLRYYDKDFVELVEEQILNSDLYFNSQNIANTLLAFAEFGMSYQDNVVSNLLQKLQRVTRPSVQDYTNSIYALSALGCHPDMVQELVDVVAKYFQTKQLNFLPKMQLCQLWRSQLYYQSVNQYLYLPAHLQEKCMRAGQEYLQSLAQYELPFLETVYTYIIKQGFNCRKRVLVQGDQLEVNILIYSNNGNQVVIMTNSCACYAVNDSGKLLGRRKFVISIIRNFGYNVVEVSEIEWKTRDSYKNIVLKQIRKYL
eukprot:TRINITY_DN8204_c0_g1_i4.p1 TRINITY_DN8204_c0_g1~~TRINITY_DN8204_c0_g1_i4.p1  ORF type:complete len:512 (-),score=14.37 TRINITY_DN8204_c0_g1_i4:508-2043(-)